MRRVGGEEQVHLVDFTTAATKKTAFDIQRIETKKIGSL